MKHWHTCGAFGDEVYELNLWDVIKLLCGKELELGSTVVSFGKSKLQSHPRNYAGNREQQLVKRYD